jgi:transposase
VKDPKKKEQFIELRSQGVSFASIAKKLDVSKSTLIAWSKNMQEDIANMKEIHREALREKYRMGEERRMKLFAKRLEAVEGELEKRDLTKVSTERLYDLLMKLGRELNVVDAPVTFKKRSGSFEIDPDAMCTVSQWQA